MSSQGDSANSSGEFVLVADEVRVFAENAVSVAAAVRAALQTATGDVETLTSGGWSGTAAQGFFEVWEGLSDQGQSIATSIAQLAAKLGISIDSLETQDVQRAATISSLDLP
ncbi:WXG100 family type VII secretion target [Nocardia sp. NPDC058480]|uniref:WXG100 family type VII secretion target n=1 Tax=Nocardia sp. NPDC058480 TaxID=3346522 RepID=UPI0036539F45